MRLWVRSRTVYCSRWGIRKFEKVEITSGENCEMLFSKKKWKKSNTMERCGNNPNKTFILSDIMYKFNKFLGKNKSRFEKSDYLGGEIF